MSDQQAATEQPADSPEQGTGTEEAPQIPAGYIPEKDYKELQAGFTRTSQEAAELRQRQDDPEYQAQIAKQWLDAQGFQLPDEEEDSQFQQELDPRIAAKLAKIDEFEQQLNTRSETEQREQNYTQYREQFDPQLKELGVPEAFLTNVADIAYNQLDAIQTPNGPQPDLEGAVKWFKEVAEMFADVPEVQTKVRKSWANTKPTRALTSPGGTDGTQVPNLDDQEERHAFMAQRLADLNAE